MMGANIVDSKIQIPCVSSPNLIVREELVTRLDRRVRLLVLHATVGYGKTVLLTHYAHRTADRCAWYHLGDTDNDPAVFMQYLCAAVKKCLPEFDFDADAFTPLLREKGAAQTMVQDFVARVEAAVRRTPGNVVLILDDFQAVTNETVHQIIGRILNNTTERVRLVLATKGSIPPFYFRHFLHGAADLIAQGELSFRKDEVRALTRLVAGDEGNGEAISAIWRKTEGWPAGVMFASLYLKQNNRGPHGPGLGTVYAKSAVHTYFMFEIFKKLPYKIQLFLTDTSALEFLSPEVCNAVLGIDNAQSVLDYLEQENLFLIKVGGSDREFRYHSLFKEFLEAQLRDDARREILNRAAEHYLSTDHKELAVEYALAAGNWDLAQYALETVGRDLLDQGRMATLTRWLSLLGETPQPLTPKNLLLAGCYYSRIGRVRKAEEYLEAALALFISSMDEWGYIRCMVEKARIARHQLSLEESNRLIEEVLPRLEARHGSLWYTVVGERLFNFIFQGRYREVLAICSEMILKARREGSRRAEGYFIRFSVIVYFYLGKYRKGLRLYSHLRERKWFREEKEDVFSVDAYAAFMHLCTGQKEAALGAVRQELARRNRGHKGEDMWLVYLFHAYINFILALDERAGAGERKRLRREAERSIYMAKNYVSAFRSGHPFVKTVQVSEELILFNPLEAALSETAGRIAAERCHAVPLVRDLAAAGLALLFHDRGEYQAAERAARESLTGAAWETPFSACARLVVAMVCLRDGRTEEGTAALLKVKNYILESGLDPDVLPSRQGRELLALAGGGGQAPGRVRVHCFGRFKVFLPGETGEIKWRTKKAQALFAYLFDRQGRPVEKEDLLLALWPETDPKSATALLHTTLYSIRKIFAPLGLEGIIAYRKRKYAMNMALVHSDRREMDRLCRALEQGDQTLMFARARTLRCYQGGYLDGVAGDFGEARRAYYEKMFLQLCRLWAERARQAGDYEGAVDCLEQAIAVDPYSEGLYVMLMACFGAMGAVGRAKHYYQRIVRVLRDDLGVTPGKELTAAYQNCFAHGAGRERLTAL